MSGKSGCEYIKCEYVRRDTEGVRCTHPGGICIYRDEADTITRLTAENAALREEVENEKRQTAEVERWYRSADAERIKQQTRAEQAEAELAAEREKSKCNHEWKEWTSTAGRTRQCIKCGQQYSWFG